MSSSSRLIRISIVAILVACLISLLSIFVNDEAYAVAPKISVTKKSIKAGKSFTLKVKNAKTSVKWKTSNKKVATVSFKGKVTAKKAGTATITARIGKKTLKCKVTVNAYINRSSVILFAGESMNLKVVGANSAIKWNSSNTKIATVTSSGRVTAKAEGNAIITAKMGKKTFKCYVISEREDDWYWGDNDDDDWWWSDPDPEPPVEDISKKLVEKVESYTYKITSINGKLNKYIFVETNNPDPMSFQFEDTSSKYINDDSKALYKPITVNYSDVQYTNTKTHRIADKGYIFWNDDANSDGGTLKLLANDGYRYDVNGSFISYQDGTNYETSKTFSITSLETIYDYIIRTYAADKTDFWDKMDAIQEGMDDITRYPKPLLDTSKPWENGNYPCLATSPYPELTLNKHIENMYKRADSLFLDLVYGFTLDSAGFPYTIGKIAKMIKPDCEVNSSWHHALRDITYNGETRTYGGDGQGTTYPLYSKFIDWKFKFDGTDIGLGTNASLKTMRDYRDSIADKSDELANSYLAKLDDDKVKGVIGDGSWMKCATEGSSIVSYCYAYKDYNGNLSYASDAWVDGRYVDKYECYSLYKYVKQGDEWVRKDINKFSDSPTSDIILNNVNYKTKSGVTKTGTVCYVYQEDKDYWSGIYYYYPWWTDSDIAKFEEEAPELILTHEEVDELVKDGVIGGKQKEYPTSGYIYDGSSEPGTYSNKM